MNKKFQNLKNNYLLYNRQLNNPRNGRILIGKEEILSELNNLISDIIKSDIELYKIQLYELLELFMRDGFSDAISNAICLYTDDIKYQYHYNILNNYIIRLNY